MTDPFQAAPEFTMQVNNDSIRVQSSTDGSARPPAIPQGIPPTSETASDGNAPSINASGAAKPTAADAKSVVDAVAAGSKRKQMSGNDASGGSEFKRMRATEFWKDVC